MSRRTPLVASLLLLIAMPAAVFAATTPEKDAPRVRLADGTLQIALDARSGELCSLVNVADGGNQLAEGAEPLALWQLTTREGGKPHVLTADKAGPVKIQQLNDGRPGLRLTWDAVPGPEQRSLKVEVVVRLGAPGQSRWEFTLTKPADLRVSEVAFPRVPRLKPRANAMLAVPAHMGLLYKDPTKLVRGADGKGRRSTWFYPGGLSLQCLAYYEPDGLGFYAACDDAQAYSKSFSLWGDAAGQAHFEVNHLPEQEAVGMDVYRVPYAVVLGSFCGDWSTAAALYRQSPAAKAWAERGRLKRGLTPEWVRQVGLWVWNRGRSGQVLVPAAAMQEHLGAPVSVFWHWWHDCPYDAGFPEYLPPREGAESFRAAVEKAQRQDIHSLIYMNQRLWGTATKSWTEERAEAFAVKGLDGKIRTEIYNIFMKAPCAPMCPATEFWRNKYAGLARDAVCDLKVDGIYMDQACLTLPCYDASHGHVLGRGRCWTDAFGLLSSTIRDQCSLERRVGLAGEFCGEPWLAYLDLMLNLEVSQERTSGGATTWSPIPLFQAVYHGSAVYYGSYGPLLSPPYDERWPAEKAPPGQLSLLDRKFARQFYLEQARSFAWGQQPTLPNFLPRLLVERPEEIDYVKRAVHTRLRALKYLLHGDWLRPPRVDVPQREIDISKIGTYIKMVESKKEVSAVVLGAWRAADGDVGIAMAGIDDTPLALSLPIDVKGYGLGDNTVVYRTDHAGRQRLGTLGELGPNVRLELPPRGVWMLELSAR